MVEKTAVAKLREDRAKKAKEYKTSHDVERVHHLIGALTLLRDQTGAAAVAASLARELTAFNLKQQELDEKEKEENLKEEQAAVASDRHSTEEENHSSPPTRAPSAPSVRR